MTSIPVTDLQGHQLSKFGFVHVTGLSMEIFEGGALTAKCLLASQADCRRFSIHYDTLFVVTENGEIWVHQLQHDDPITHDMYYIQLEALLCPLGEGKAIIADPWRINYLSTYDILTRLADPTWNETVGGFPLVRTRD